MTEKEKTSSNYSQNRQLDIENTNPIIYTPSSIGLSVLFSDYEKRYAPPEIEDVNSKEFAPFSKELASQDMWYFGLVLWHLFDSRLLPFVSGDNSLKSSRQLITQKFIEPSRPQYCLQEHHDAFIRPCLHRDPTLRITSQELLILFEKYFENIKLTTTFQQTQEISIGKNEVTPLETSAELSKLKNETKEILKRTRKPTSSTTMQNVSPSSHYVSWTPPSSTTSHQYDNIPKEVQNRKEKEEE